MKLVLQLLVGGMVGLFVNACTFLLVYHVFMPYLRRTMKEAEQKFANQMGEEFDRANRKECKYGCACPTIASNGCSCDCHYEGIGR